tara:strand:+ start:6621 stop:8651 length:2031 start_codon:yes stop_codon:yes gene_type:complete
LSGNNPYSARASFEVRDPTVAANALLSNQVSLTNNKRTNFQTGINTAITQAAASQRDRLQQEAAMARQLQTEDANKQEAIRKQTYEEQKALEQLKLDFRGKTTDSSNAINYTKLSQENSNSIAQHRMNLMAKKGELQLEAAKFGLTNDPGFQNTLKTYDHSIKATNLALGIPDEEQSISESSFQTTGTDPVTGLPAPKEATTTPVDPMLQQMADGLKGSFDTKNLAIKKAQLEVNKLEKEVGISNPAAVAEKQKLINGVFQDLQENGVPISQDEIQLYTALEDKRQRASTGEASKKFAEAARVSTTEISPKLKELNVDLNSMNKSFKSAMSLGVRVDSNAMKEARAVLSRVGGDNSAGISEMVESLKASNIFDFKGAINPDGSPVTEGQKKQIKNDFITGLNQLEASSPFLARQGGETGTLTNQDIMRALRTFVSPSGDISEFVNNMDRGITKLQAGMSRNAYMYEDMGDFHYWRQALDDSGYKLTKDGIAEEKTEYDNAQGTFGEATTTFSEGLTPDEELEYQTLLEQEAAGTLQEEVDPLSSAIQQAEQASGVTIDPNLVQAIIQQESGGDPSAVSPVGAQGLMQLMPATAAELGVQDPLDPVQNLNGGVQYVGQLLRKYGGDTNKALAAYNWGMGNVDKAISNYGENYLQYAPEETKNYVGNILKMYGQTGGQ